MSIPTICGCVVTRCQAVTNLIQSVALEEAALSNILEAEGKKLCAAIEMRGVTTAELLCVNKSVQSMVNAITRLEMVLQAKLELVSCEICPICPTHP